MAITVRGTISRIEGIPLDEGKKGASVTITTKDLPPKLFTELSALYEKEAFVTFAYPEKDNQTDLFAGSTQTGHDEANDQPLPFPRQ